MNRAEISNLNVSVGQTRTYKVTRGPHSDADATMAVPELTRNSFYILFPVKSIVSYRQIFSIRVCVRIIYSSRLRNLFIL